MHFWSQLLRFFVLHKTLYFDKFNGGDFKYNNSFFQFQLWNTHKTYLWSRIWCFSFLLEMLHFGKFEGVDLKYNNSFFKFKFEILVKVISGLNFVCLLVLYKTLHFGKFEGCNFKYDDSFSKLHTKDPQNTAFLVRDLRIIVFAQNFVFGQARGFVLQIWR